VFYSDEQLMFGKEMHIDPVGKAQNKHSKNVCNRTTEQLQERRQTAVLQ